MATTMHRDGERIVATNGFAPSEATAPAERVRGGYVWGTLRLLMGWTFFWSFLDKLFGLGFSTGRLDSGVINVGGPDAWINGGSPTYGFLTFGTKGPFKGFFGGLAGASATTTTWLDWVFMLSLAVIGLALLLGIGTRVAAIGGAAWMVLFYLAGSIWPDHNPFFDEHVLQFVVLIGIAVVGAGRWLGFGRWWEDTKLVKRFPILK